MQLAGGTFHTLGRMRARRKAEVPENQGLRPPLFLALRLQTRKASLDSGIGASYYSSGGSSGGKGPSNGPFSGLHRKPGVSNCLKPSLGFSASGPLTSCP